MTTLQSIQENSKQTTLGIKNHIFDCSILALTTYKLLCEHQLLLLKTYEFPIEELSLLSEYDHEVVAFIQSKLGYFISYKNLFSTWLSLGHDFDISHVIDAMHAYHRLSTEQRKEECHVLEDFQSIMCLLGKTSAIRTPMLCTIIHAIK